MASARAAIADTGGRFTVAAADGTSCPADARKYKLKRIESVCLQQRDTVTSDIKLGIQREQQPPTGILHIESQANASPERRNSTAKQRVR